jgi:hypothetical protein
MFWAQHRAKHRRMTSQETAESLPKISSGQRDEKVAREAPIIAKVVAAKSRA